jgi:hypothetical protein|tara:strand:+ start:920 stop:2005 length:1086 start_codon:yes stop_codon:yes gene_type:complete
MKFLDQKEEVIDLEITPYGKSLLSKGMWKPAYYAFYDDEVLYDSHYAGITEAQNSASVRIREVPQLQTQAHFYSAEKKVKEAVAFHLLNDEEKQAARSSGLEPSDINSKPYVMDDNVTIEMTPDREFNKAPIGTSAHNSQYAPSWDINVIEGEISSSTEILQGLNLPIPQLNMSASMYEYVISEEAMGESFYKFDEDGQLSENHPLKNKFLNVVGKSVILEVDETNTDFSWENFDIEVYEVEQRTFSDAQTVGGTHIKEFLKPLVFPKIEAKIKNNILQDTPETAMWKPDFNQFFDPRYAEYFLQFIVDDDIDPSKICDRIRDKPLGLYSRKTINCQDSDSQERVDISNLYQGDDSELCSE